MKTYQLHNEQYLPIPIEQAWQFFSSAKNLAKITPPEMGFVILSQLDDRPIYTGMKIEYTIRPLFNIPLHWVTEIRKVDAPYQFTDAQLKGPYSLWEHTHTFERSGAGVLMTDDVKYALPFGWPGRLMHRVIVKKKLADIFSFREVALKKLFG